MTEDAVPARPAGPDESDVPAVSGACDEPGRRGSLVITDRAMVSLAVIAAGEVEDSTATGRRRTTRPLSGSGLPRAEVRVSGGRARISVDVAAPWPLPAADVAARVRAHVSAQVTALAGLVVDAVDVTVADIVRARPAARVR